MKEEKFNGITVKRIVVGSLETNCYLVFSDDEMVVVDPGGDSKKIIDEIKNSKIVPNIIINTHHHPDHVSANEKVKDATGAEIFEGLREGYEINLGNNKLKVMETPGHTKDSISLLGEGFLISGDVLFSEGHGRTDLPGGSGEEMTKTLNRLRREIPDEVTIYPGHGEPFKMKEGKKVCFLM